MGQIGILTTEEVEMLLFFEWLMNWLVVFYNRLFPKKEHPK